MSDVHTKNQRPSSKNGLRRACLRPWFLLQGGDLVSVSGCQKSKKRRKGKVIRSPPKFWFSLPHQWMTFTPKISVLAQKMGSWERACVRFFQKIRFRVGVSEIQKTKKRQSLRISAKKLILNAPPMNDVHTKNQSPSSKNGLVRAGPRPLFFTRVRYAGSQQASRPITSIPSAQSRDIENWKWIFFCFVGTSFS